MKLKTRKRKYRKSPVIHITSDTVEFWSLMFTLLGVVVDVAILVAIFAVS